jgi:hypothetical protein
VVSQRVKSLLLANPEGILSPSMCADYSPGPLEICLLPNVQHEGAVAGKVNSADKLYLVIESVKMDTKHNRCSTAPPPADGAGGSPMN